MAFDPRGREQAWTQAGRVYSAAVMEGRIYAQRNGSDLMVLDAAKGTEIATISREGAHNQDQVLAGGRVIATLDTVTGALEFFDLDRRASVRKVESEMRTREVRTVVSIAGDGAVYADAGGKRVESIDLRDAAKGWRRDFGEPPTGLTRAGQRIVVAAGRRLIGLDAATGRPMWETPLEEKVVQLLAGVER
jgi:outer membrane protein assembly factor BamB